MSVTKDEQGVETKTTWERMENVKRDLEEKRKEQQRILKELGY